MSYSSSDSDDDDNDLNVNHQYHTGGSRHSMYSSSEEEGGSSDEVSGGAGRGGDSDSDSDSEENNDGGISQQSYSMDQSFDSNFMTEGSFQHQQQKQQSMNGSDDEEDNSDSDSDDQDNGDNGGNDDSSGEELNNISTYTSASYMANNRLSMATNDSTVLNSTFDGSMHDNSMMNNEYDSDSEDDSAGNSGDEMDVSRHQNPSSIASAASGKVFIRPNNKDSDSEDDDDEEQVSVSINQDQGGEDDDNDDDDDDMESEAAFNNNNKINSDGQHLTGKPLSMATRKTEVETDEAATAAVVHEEESSSDDELLVTHKSKTSRKSVESAKTLKQKKKAVTKKKKKKTVTVKKTKTKKVTKAIAKLDDDDDAIEAVAVLDDDAGATNSDSDNTVEAVIEAIVVPQAPPKKKRKKPGPKPKKKPKDGKNGSSKIKRGRGKKGGDKHGDKRSYNNKKRSKSGNDSDSDASCCVAASIIPEERLSAANKSREALLQAVQRTPIEISSSHTVRNFGRIKIEEETNVLDTLYSNATALYPVGFSCDRYEFSPVHGRFLKMRCDILDGKSEEKSSPEQKVDASNTSGQTPNKKEDVDKKSTPKPGPIFRIMWGRGVDEVGDEQSFPFDLYSASAPLGNEVDVVAVPVGADTIKIKPEQGMRVKVRFDNDIWYHGSILQVSEKKVTENTKKKNSTRGNVAKKEKKQKFSVEILYDDGVKEMVTFPDPDVLLVPPGKCTNAYGFFF